MSRGMVVVVVVVVVGEGGTIWEMVPCEKGPIVFL